MSLFRIIGFVLISGAVAGLFAVVWTAPDWVLDEIADRYPGCVYRVPIEEPFLAFTFDDGPDAETTPQILGELRRHRIRATFFLISSKLPGNEKVVETIVREGHEVGNHFTRDRPSIRLDSADFEHDLMQAHGALASFAPVRWARPGAGWYSQQMTETMRRNDYRCALGSIYPFDVAIPSVFWATRYILRNARPGRIVVLHDGGARGRRTARILAQVIPELLRRGYRFEPLSDLVEHPRRKVLTRRANALGVL